MASNISIHHVAVKINSLERPHREHSYVLIWAFQITSGKIQHVKHELNHASNPYWATTKVCYIFSVLWLLLACPRIKYKFSFTTRKSKTPQNYLDNTPLKSFHISQRSANPERWSGCSDQNTSPGLQLLGFTDQRYSSVFHSTQLLCHKNELGICNN